MSIKAHMHKIPTIPEPVPSVDLSLPREVDGVKLRYKLSSPEFIFEDKCLPETCLPDPLITQRSKTSGGTHLKEIMSSIFLKAEGEGLRDAAHSFVPSGVMIAPELKRKEFMDYLKKTGFITGIGKMLIAIYDEEELAEDDDGAIEFIARSFGYGLTQRLEIEALEKQKTMLAKKIAKYEREHEILRKVMDKYEAACEEIEIVDPEKLPPLEFIKLDDRHKSNEEEDEEEESLIEPVDYAYAKLKTPDSMILPKNRDELIEIVTANKMVISSMSLIEGHPNEMSKDRKKSLTPKGTSN